MKEGGSDVTGEEDRNEEHKQKENTDVFKKKKRHPVTIRSCCPCGSVFKGDMMFGVNEMTLTSRVRALLCVRVLLKRGRGLNNSFPMLVIDSSCFVSFFPGV